MIKKKLICYMLITAIILGLFMPIPSVARSTENSKGSIPAKYDLRSYGLVSSVKNQGQMGTCYAFALCSTLESNALMKGYGEFNLSERHLAYFTTHYGNAGNSAIDKECPEYCEDKKWYDEHTAPGPIATLMKGFGPALDKSYPYSGIKGTLSADSARDCILKCTSCIFLPYDDPAAVKNAVMKYGAVCISLYPCCINNNKVFNRSSGAIYASDTSKGSGFHYVTIVGWDDNYSKNNFLTTPPGDGAWIVKNSWGKNIGDKGYCYLSYYDAELNDSLNPWFTFEVCPTSIYDTLHQYDGGAGITLAEGVSSVAMTFKPTENETITGISIKPSQATTATINIYKNVNTPKSIGSAKAVHTQKFDVSYAGYQMLTLNKGINVNAGETVLVTVTFKDSIGYYTDAAYESDRETGGRGIASAKMGETFIKKGNSWYDLANYSSKPASACLKVLSKKGHNRRVIPRDSANLGQTALTVTNNNEAAATLSWKEIKNAKTYDIYRKADGEKGYTLIKSVSSKTLKYEDSKLTLGKKYSYMVIAVSGSSESSCPEKTVTATIQSTCINSLDNSQSGKIKITIKKTASATAYSVYRLEGKSYKWIGSTTTGTYVDSTVRSGTTYTYKVRATKGKLLSAFSWAKKITAK